MRGGIDGARLRVRVERDAADALMDGGEAYRDSSIPIGRFSKRSSTKFPILTKLSAVMESEASIRMAKSNWMNEKEEEGQKPRKIQTNHRKMLHTC